MREYELALIFNSALTEDKRKKLLETIKGWLKDAKVKGETVLGQKSLSYPIKKQKMGYYYIFAFDASSVATDFEKRLLSQEDILRHLLVRKK